jgi:hypothetical protein
VFQHRLEPDELTAKHLAMLGSAVLILVHSVRERYASSNTVAGEARRSPQPAERIYRRTWLSGMPKLQSDNPA